MMNDFEKLNSVFDTLSNKGIISFHNLIYTGYKDKKRGHDTIKTIQKVLRDNNKEEKGVIYYEYDSVKNCIYKKGELELFYYKKSNNSTKDNINELISLLNKYNLNSRHNKSSNGKFESIIIRDFEFTNMPKENEFGLKRSLSLFQLNLTDFKPKKQVESPSEKHPEVYLYCFNESEAPGDVVKNVNINYKIDSYSSKPKTFGIINWPGEVKENIQSMDAGEIIFSVEGFFKDFKLIWHNEKCIELIFSKDIKFENKKEFISTKDYNENEKSETINIIYSHN